MEEHGKDCDARIGENAELDQLPRVISGRETAKDNGTGEGYDLGQQQREKQAGAVQAQGRAVGRGHVDDGIYAVDKEEKGQQIQENMLLPLDLLEGPGQLGEGIPDGVRRCLHIGLLPVFPEQGQGADQPPGGNDQEGQHHGGGHRQADLASKKHQHQADHEGDHGADVAIGIAQGGHIVHSLFGGDLRQHGVIKDQTGGKANFCQYKNHQKGQPGPGCA